MNIYIRYFDHETITKNLDELVDFIASIDEISITPELVEDLKNYINCDNHYPKRYKVRTRVYFILIKTEAETLEEFRLNRKSDNTIIPETKVNSKINRLSEIQEGWYWGKLLFKRVLLIPGTQKYQYRDTLFSAYVKAESPLHCYNRILEHLRGRTDVDSRSQFPSAKGNNFVYEYLGASLPVE